MNVEVTEAQVLRACLALLKLRGIVAIRNNTGAAKIGGRLVRFGSVGSPDLLLCVKGRFVGVEVKRPGGKLTEAQRAALEAIREAGGVAVVVSDARQLEAILDELGADRWAR